MIHQLILPALGLVLLSAVAAPSQTLGPQTLDRLVPPDRQVALGLSKLSPAQRAALVLLLQEFYSLGVRDGSATAAQQSTGARTETPAVIESQIDGEFEGWEGETLVRLTNGQIWQQTEYHYHYHYAYMPTVLIFRKGGQYKMKVDGIERAVGVERLR